MGPRLFSVLPGRRALGAAILGAGLALGAFVGASAAQSLTSLPTGLPQTGPAITHEAPALRVAQGVDPAALQVRISQLEEQVRVFSGQIEGLQFQMTQLQTLLERMQEDNEFRFQQLEDGSLGKTEAVTSPGGERPTEALPPAPDSDRLPADQEAWVGDEDLMDGQEDQQGELYGGPLGPDGGEDDEILTRGPLLGAPPGPLGTTTPSAPLDLDFDSGSILSDGDASAQYQAGYEAVVRGDYAFAEDQFRQFIALFPDHANTPDAIHWLGEAMIQRGAYDEAADILLTGFESHPTSGRAPDMLLKLGVALHGAGEFDTACRTYQEVLRRYPDQSTAFRSRVADEQARAGC